MLHPSKSELEVNCKSMSDWLNVRLQIQKRKSFSRSESVNTLEKQKLIESQSLHSVLMSIPDATETVIIREPSK